MSIDIEVEFYLNQFKNNKYIKYIILKYIEIHWNKKKSGKQIFFYFN